MARAPFQVLVIPYRRISSRFEFLVFSRSDGEGWQGIAGGGEDAETPLQAAKRESFEEAGIEGTCEFMPLQSVASIPVIHFPDHRQWGAERYVIPEHCFGVAVSHSDVVLSAEHRAAAWVWYDEAMARLTYDSNRTALWELAQRLAKVAQQY